MIKLDMSESDIIRAIKNNTKSPLEYLVSRHFKQDIRDVDASKDGIIIWEYDADDYISYRYCEEDIQLLDQFLLEWEEFASGEINDFAFEPISFCVYQNG
jgi:hypothetical protein